MSEALKGGEENVVFYGRVGLLSSSSVSMPTSHAQIEAGSFPCPQITYSLSSTEHTQYKDRPAYPNSLIQDETKAQEQITEILAMGNRFISLLYTYRSCSKALPMIQGDTGDEERLDVHKKTFAILRPEMLKIKEFMEFHEKTVSNIRQNLSLVLKVESAKQVQSDTLLDYIVKEIDLLVLLDALKDMKACLLNDFARYKRAFSPLRESLSDSNALSDEISNLQMFLSNPQQPHNLIMFHLKTDVQKLTGYDVAVTLLLNHCIDCIDEKRYLLPAQFHLFHRVIPNLIYLLDSDDKKVGLNVFKGQGGSQAGSGGKVKIDRAQRILKAFPIIPLYADMHIDAMFVLRKCLHWEEETMLSLWTTAKHAKLPQRYELRYHRNKIRDDYNGFTSTLTSLINEVKAYTLSKKVISPEVLHNVFSTTLTGFRLLSSWSAKVAEQQAWKYSNPKSVDEYKKMGGKGEAGQEYEQAIRYNYGPEELYALIDVIGMIKGLGSLLSSNELLLLPLIRRCIHDELQIFLQQEVARPLRKAHKRGRKDIKELMIQMRSMAGDWINAEQQKDDYMQPKKDLIQVNRDFPRRAASPSFLQIFLIRRMMHTIFSPKAAGMQGGFFAEKDLKKEWIPTWEAFYSSSYFWTYLLDFSNTLTAITDTSDFWFREFYLEVTKCVQFPISMSMPWLMTEFLIATPSMKENIFMAMDIYNDAANRALVVLKQQFLYDEIEAELNLSFDQLMFHLSEDIFKYFKTVASSVLINKTYESKFFALKQSRSTLINARYTALLSQRHVQLLGRTVNVLSILSQHVNSYVRRNLDFVIRRFESGDLCNVVEIAQLLDNVKMTHTLLQDFLNLDEWEYLFREVNEDTTLGLVKGRIVQHAFSELVSDIFPAFTYNDTTSRFVRAPHAYKEPPDRARLPSGINSYYWYGRQFKDVFDKTASITRNFFGLPHIAALNRILSLTDYPLLLNELMNEVENRLIYDFSPYARALIEAVPPLKPPKLAYGVVGGYGFYDVKFKATIAGYAPLRPAVFQSLREIGNALLFLRLLDTSLNVKANLAFTTQAYLFGVKPVQNKTPLQAGQSAPDVPFTLPSDVPSSSSSSSSSPSSSSSSSSSSSTLPLLSHVREAFAAIGSSGKQVAGDDRIESDILSALSNASNMYAYSRNKDSLLTGALSRLDAAISRNVRAEWIGQYAPGAVVEVDNPRSLERLLSCLQFILCQPPLERTASNAYVVDDLAAFGEGFNFAVCTLIHLIRGRASFEQFDASYHILRMNSLAPVSVNVLDPKQVKKGVAPTEAQKLHLLVLDFLKNVRIVKAKNDELFGALESHFSANSHASSLSHYTNEHTISWLSPPTDAELAAPPSSSTAAATMSMTGTMNAAMITTNVRNLSVSMNVPQQAPPLPPSSSSSSSSSSYAPGVPAVQEDYSAETNNNNNDNSYYDQQQAYGADGEQAYISDQGQGYYDEGGQPGAGGGYDAGGGYGYDAGAGYDEGSSSSSSSSVYGAPAPPPPPPPPPPPQPRH